MSIVISSMPAAGLIEMPPVSKTTPLPQSASGAASPPPFHCMTTTFDGLVEPCPTASSVRIPSAASSGSSSTSTSTPSSLAAPVSRSANSVVVSTFAGSLVRSRARNTPSAWAASGEKAAAAASGARTWKVTARFGAGASGSGVRYSRNS